MNPYESGAVIDMNVGHNSANHAPIGADALREALWVCVEHNALHFGETHNTVVQGRAALANSAPEAAPAPASVARPSEDAVNRAGLYLARKHAVYLSRESVRELLAEAAQAGGCVAKQCSDAIREGQGKG